MNKLYCCIALLASMLLLGPGAIAQEDTEIPDEPIIEQGELPVEEEAAPEEEPEYVEPSQPEPPLVESAESADPAPDAPELPTLDEVMSGKNRVEDFIPMDFSFRVGIIGEIVEEVETYDGGTTTVTKSPLMLLDPRNGIIKVYAKNFPARIVANSANGQWVVAIAPSAAVEGTSGSANKEAAVSLNMPTGEIRLIAEFPRHSNFQALFLEQEKNTVLYCVNEPGVVNQIFRFNLETRAATALPAEGNRFHLYGLKQPLPGQKNPQLWVRDPMSVSNYPVVSLLDIQQGTQLDRIEFPGTDEVLAQPGGATLLASVEERAQSSLGYYDSGNNSFRQIEDLVLTRPQIKWLHNSKAIIVKEATATKDRFTWVDIETGESREIFSAYYKIGQWDISPDDDALVFTADSDRSPILFVMPLDPAVKGINRIRLKNMANITWLGCLNPPDNDDGGGGGGSWLDKLIPKF